jgi:hypothetical protein
MQSGKDLDYGVEPSGSAITAAAVVLCIIIQRKLKDIKRLPV